MIYINSLGLPFGEGSESGRRPVWPSVDLAEQNAAHLASCAPPYNTPLAPISCFDLYNTLKVCSRYKNLIILINIKRAFSMRLTSVKHPHNSDFDKILYIQSFWPQNTFKIDKNLGVNFCCCNTVYKVIQFFFQIKKHILPCDTVYSLAMERISSQLWHPGWQELEQDIIAAQEATVRESIREHRLATNPIL